MGGTPTLPKDAREKLLDAALELFVRDGYDCTSTRAIARRARVNEVTLFRRFGSKQKVFLAVMERAADVKSSLDALSVEPSGDLAGDLFVFGKMMKANMLERAPLMKLMMMEMSRRPELFRHIAPAPEAAVGFLVRYFKRAREKGLVRDVDPRLAAVAFFSFFFRMLVTRAFLGREPFLETDDEAMGGFCRLMAEGLVRKQG